MVRRLSGKPILMLMLVLFTIPLLACNLAALIGTEPTPVPTIAVVPTTPPQPTVAPQPTLPPQPTSAPKATTANIPTAQAPKPSGVITSATMAQSTTGDTKDPVNPTIVFPPNAIFHAVVAIKSAPQNTKFTAAWYVTDVGTAAAPNTLIDSTDLTSAGTRNLDFTLTPNNTWPTGKYRVEISVNGTLDRIVDFSVSGSSAQAPIPTRTGGTQPTAAPKTSGFITGVTMALDAQGANKDPVNPTNTFSPKATFHAVVAIKDAPANTVFKATWYAEDVGTAASPNTLIDSSDLTTDGTRNIDFTLTPNNQWPTGTFRVEIYVNGTLDRTVGFSVK